MSQNKLQKEKCRILSASSFKLISLDSNVRMTSVEAHLLMLLLEVFHSVEGQGRPECIRRFLCTFCAFTLFESRQIVFTRRLRYGLVSISSILTANFNPQLWIKAAIVQRHYWKHQHITFGSKVPRKPRPLAVCNTKGGTMFCIIINYRNNRSGRNTI